MSDVIELPIVKPAIEIDEETKTSLLSKVREESQVVVHCEFDQGIFEIPIRIWKSTYLIPKGGGEKSELVHCENISLYPVWTIPKWGTVHHFTLIFTGLPKDCMVFDLIEQIPEKGGFEVRNIKRNQSDVYHVEVE